MKNKLKKILDEWNEESDFEINVFSGNEKTKDRIGIHLFKPNENEFIDALEQASKNLFYYIYIYNESSNVIHVDFKNKRKAS